MKAAAYLFSWLGGLLASVTGCQFAVLAAIIIMAVLVAVSHHHRIALKKPKTSP